MKFELNCNYFLLLPLQLLFLGFFDYKVDTIVRLRGCLERCDFSSRLEHSIALNTRREIKYLRAPIYYFLFIQSLVHIIFKQKRTFSVFT